ncbi:MAG: glycosyltransferase family 61 protein [Adhaeribacter sp.]
MHALVKGFKTLVYQFLSFLNYYYFPASLLFQKKKVHLPPYRLSFSPEETAFLTSSAGTYGYQTDYSAGFLQKPVFTCTLENVTFLGNSGALVKQNKIIAESAFDQVRLCLSPAYRSPALLWPGRKKGLYTSLLHLPWAHKSNYHWFFDCLPRLYALLEEVREPIQLIVNRDILSFQLETLQFLIKDHPHFRICFIGKNEKWQLEHFLFSSFVSNHSSGYLPAPIAAWLAGKIREGYQVEEKTERTRLYISRSKASKRRVLNEEQLIPLLLQHGFRIVHAEELTYRQQVELFAQAACVVAPHGAGLTNILFARNCSVLELHPADLIKPHYFLAAKALGLPYSYLTGPASAGKMDFTIDPIAFEARLLEMLSL